MILRFDGGGGGIGFLDGFGKERHGRTNMWLGYVGVGTEAD